MVNCKIAGCSNSYKRLIKGMCNPHYQQEYYSKNLERAKLYRELNKEKRSMSNKQWMHENATYRQEYLDRTREKRAEQARMWAAANTERLRENGRKWKLSNPEKVLAHKRSYMLRRAKQIKLATPPWADREEIKRIYASCPKGCAVDHVVPLMNRNVSGLNIPINLRYVTVRENMEKSNKWIK